MYRNISHRRSSQPTRPIQHEIYCRKCNRPCSGAALKVANDFFHSYCFVCKVCGCALADIGYFVHGEDHYCVYDYHRIFGTRCSFCGGFIEGEATTDKGEAFHKRCFKQKDRRLWKPEVRNNYQVPIQRRNSAPPQRNINYPKCAGCQQLIRGGQALLALEKKWHTLCFKCAACGKQLSGEYLGKDGVPYCENDYLRMFGILCNGCQNYIIGKFLEAGEKNFHLQCALCAKCNKHFDEGQELLVYKNDLYHTVCFKTNEVNRASKASNTSEERKPSQKIPRKFDNNASNLYSLHDSPIRQEKKSAFKKYDPNRSKFSARNLRPDRDMIFERGGTDKYDTSKHSVIVDGRSAFNSVQARPKQGYLYSITNEENRFDNDTVTKAPRSAGSSLFRSKSLTLQGSPLKDKFDVHAMRSMSISKPRSFEYG